MELELFEDATAVGEALRAAGAEVAQHGNRLEVRGGEADTYDLVRDVVAAHDAGIRRLGVRSTTLEDIFLEEGANEGSGHG